MALVGALVLGGCGSSGTTTVVERTTVEQTAPHSATSIPAPAAPAAAPASGPVRHLSSFQSPSGNISCQLVGGGGRCDIAQRNWSPPPRPASCPNVVDFGQGLALTAGRTAFVCAGDTTRDPASPRLAYGSASRVGPVTCTSRTAGTSCTDRRTHHGFSLSVQGYRLF